MRSQFLTPATDPRSLILRVLAALAEGADGAQREEELLGFLGSSFGAFQARQDRPSWAWSRSGLARALTELTQHQLVEAPAPGRYRLTELGRFAGQAGVRVDSIIRLVAVLRTISVALNSAVLGHLGSGDQRAGRGVRAVQPARHQHRAPPLAGELASQAIPHQLLAGLGIGGPDPLARVARAKKAVACLLYASDTPLDVLERHLTQHQREDGGVAGAVRQAAARTRDMLPTVVQVASSSSPSWTSAVWRSEPRSGLSWASPPTWSSWESRSAASSAGPSTSSCCTPGWVTRPASTRARSRTSSPALATRIGSRSSWSGSGSGPRSASSLPRCCRHRRSSLVGA